MSSRSIAARVLSLLASAAAVTTALWLREVSAPASVPPPAVDVRRARESLAPHRVIGVRIEYDDDFDRDRGGKGAEHIAEALGIVNVEWQRYRGEWFEIADLRRRPSGDELDACHVLADFALGTDWAPSVIRVRIVGRQLEVYSDGRTASPVGGLAFRGSDAFVVSAAAGVSVELLAYYLFHEIGHLWETYDIPFAGGETTYGEKSRYTFEVDAGNAEILEGSSGPAPRDAPNLAPAILARRLADARALTRDPILLARLRDLLLHEPVPSNPAWERKKQELFAMAADERIRRFVLELESTPHERREETDVRRQLAAHYWRAHDALTREDTVAAERELDAMQRLQDAEAGENVRILIGAVERKIRRRR